MATAALAVAACVRPTPDPQDAPPTAAQFASDITAFDSADRVRPPTPGGVVFTGSSSIHMWSTLAEDFPGVAPVNRGFGGSTIPDVTYYLPRTVFPLRPRLVVLYAGDNDIAAGHTPQDVAADYHAFVAALRRVLPATRVVYVSIKPSPNRWALADKAREANALIAAEIAGDSLSRFVNVFDPMLGPTGYPRAELFIDDSLHMTPAGYALWRQLLTPLVGRSRP